MSFKILHGGRVRYSADVDTSQAYTAPGAWEKGNVLALQLDATARVVSTQAEYEGYVQGLACENRTSATDTEVDAGAKVTMLLDEAVVQTDELASGVTNFEENQILYSDVLGHITNVRANSALVIGKSLTALQSDGTIKLLFSVQY